MRRPPRRLGLSLVAVAVAVAVPAALLVAEALRAASFERDARHRVVSDRVFDEMERVLSDLLAGIEERPFEDWRFRRPDGSRSPLSTLPERAFVVGAFQVGPGGAFETPLLPPAGDPTVAAPGAPERAATLRRLVARYGERPGPRRPARAAPGPEPLAQEETEAPGGAGSAYDLLSGLNRALDRRAALRQQKVAQAPAPPEPEAAPRAARGEERADAAREDPAPRRSREPSAAGAVPETSASAGRTVRVVLDPFTGRALDPQAHYLLLSRVAVAGGRAWRQGVVLERAALAEHLRREVLARGGLADSARARFAGPGLEAAGPDPQRFSAVHRFAEPFDAFGLWLDLEPLEGVDGPGPLLALCALLALSLGGGLVAVHRTASLSLEFAERRSRLVAAVSHELRTPLTSIRMGAEMLRDGLVASPERRREWLERLTAECERLSRLLDDVLDFSRLERGRRHLAPRVGDLGAAAEDAAESLRPHVQQQGFALRTEMEPSLPPVRFDRDAVVQVLFNLVENALKHAADAPRREIVLSCRRAGRGVALAVRDFGPGVPRSHLSRVFEPFWRGEEEGGRPRGSGIGLALVRELAEAMGARARGEAPAEGGLCVRLDFPAEERA